MSSFGQERAWSIGETVVPVDPHEAATTVLAILTIVGVLAMFLIRAGRQVVG